VLFYHPAVWWVSAQIRAERELCCDDLAVAVTADVLTYARALAELEAGRPRLHAAVAADGGSLVRRITRLIGPARAPHTSPRPAAAFVLSAVLVAGVGTLAVAAAGPEPKLLLLSRAGVKVAAVQGVVIGRDGKTAVRNLGVLMSPQVSSYPTVQRDSIWIDTVKRGDLEIQVRGLGTLVSPNLAELQIAETQSREIQLGQAVRVDLRGPMIGGQVTRIHPEVHNGTVTVDVATSGIPPTAGRPPLQVDGTILIRTLRNVLHVARPVFGRGNSQAVLFRLEPDGNQAVPVNVQFGTSSVNAIEVLSGLLPGDKIILSDMRAYENAARVNLK
jgi:hypothetical protein